LEPINALPLEAGLAYKLVLPVVNPTLAKGLPAPSFRIISPPNACTNVIAPVESNAAVTSGIPAADTALMNPVTVAVLTEIVYVVVVPSVAFALVCKVKLAPTLAATGLVVAPVTMVEPVFLRYHK